MLGTGRLRTLFGLQAASSSFRENAARHCCVSSLILASSRHFCAVGQHNVRIVRFAPRQCTNSILTCRFCQKRHVRIPPKFGGSDCELNAPKLPVKQYGISESDPSRAVVRAERCMSDTTPSLGFNAASPDCARGGRLDIGVLCTEWTLPILTKSRGRSSNGTEIREASTWSSF